MKVEILLKSSVHAVNFTVCFPQPAVIHPHYGLINRQAAFVSTCATYHFGGRVEHLHLLQDGGPIVSNGHVAFLVLDLKQTTNRPPLRNSCMREELSKARLKPKSVYSPSCPCLWAPGLF